MPGVATAGYYMMHPSETFPTELLVASGVVLNEGDPIAINSSGQAVLALHGTGAGGGIVKPEGAAFFDQNNGTGEVITGDGSTVYTGMARKCRIHGMNGTLVPSIGAGLPVYLGPVSSGTVSPYTCAVPAAGYSLIEVGIVDSDATTLLLDFSGITALQVQSAATSNVTAA